MKKIIALLTIVVAILFVFTGCVTTDNRGYGYGYPAYGAYPNGYDYYGGYAYGYPGYLYGYDNRFFYRDRDRHAGFPGRHLEGAPMEGGHFEGGHFEGGHFGRR